MRRIKGLGDIKTYSALAREGRLVSVAKNLHQIVRRNEFFGEESWGGNIKSFVPKKGAKRRKFSPVLFLLDQDLKAKIRIVQMEQIRALIFELEELAKEGIAGTVAERHSLKKRLARWEKM